MSLRSSAALGTGERRSLQRRRAEAGHAPSGCQQRRTGTAWGARLEGKAGGPVSKGRPGRGPLAPTWARAPAGQSRTAACRGTAPDAAGSWSGLSALPALGSFVEAAGCCRPRSGAKAKWSSAKWSGGGGLAGQTRRMTRSGIPLSGLSGTNHLTL